MADLSQAKAFERSAAASTIHRMITVQKTSTLLDWAKEESVEKPSELSC